MKLRRSAVVLPLSVSLLAAACTLTVAACSGGSTVLVGVGDGGPGLGNDNGNGNGNGNGATSGGDGSVSCSGLECQKADCGGGSKTTLSGRVYDPAGANPLYGVTVYIPSGPLTPLGSGATCDACGTITPAPLARARTNAKGEFVLDDVPVTKDLPIVMQTGKWRREIKVDASQKCVDNKVPDRTARLPKNGLEGDMPHIAVTAGGCDALECLLRGIGIDASEFVPGASGGGHVHVFNGAGGNFPGGPPAGGTAGDPSGGDLWSSSAKLAPYDAVLLSCECDEHSANKGGDARQSMWDYANAGGRVMATHYHYTWLKDSPQNDWRQIANWGGSGGAISGAHDVNVGFKEGAAFGDWLVATGASFTPGQINLTEVTGSLTNVLPPAQRWITHGSVPRYFAFSTPTAGPSCGKVAFSDVHAMGMSSGGKVFPVGCPLPGDLNPQQKALEFLLFQMSACEK